MTNVDRMGFTAMKKHSKKELLIYLAVLTITLTANLICLRNGITDIFQHLYYLPILLGVFFYDKTGVLLAAGTSFLYLLSVVALQNNPSAVTSAMIRSLILFAMAILIYTLLKRNREQAKELFRKKMWLETTLLSIGEGVVVTDIDDVIQMSNREAQMITGLKESEVSGKKFSDAYPMTFTCPNSPIEGDDRTSYAYEGVYITPEGNRKELDLRISSILFQGKECLGSVVVFRDVTERKRIEIENQYLTYHDKLTGLYNRRFFEEETKRLDVARNLPISIVIGDVNGLKLINDVFGHLAGDQLLTAAANAVQSVCREEDIVARWGGDEYIILLPRTGSVDSEKIAERIREKCRGTQINSVALSIALGCATKIIPEDDLASVIKRADDSMYQVKLIEGKSMKNHAVQSILSTLYESVETEEVHSNRVSRFCELLAGALRLSHLETSELIVTGKVHDIGKVALDRNILNKPGKLTPEEYEAVKQHSLKGYNILHASVDLSHLANYVLYHHERWDGTGYPSGLKGTSIPFFSRILTVADTYEALTGQRPYREPVGKEEALREIQRCSASQFDPAVVDALMSVQEKL